MLAGWIEARLTGQQGKDDWYSFVDEKTSILLKQPAEQFLARGGLFERTRHITFNIGAKYLFKAWVSTAASHKFTANEWLTDRSKTILEKYILQPDLVDVDLLRTFFAQPAVHELYTDILYKALEDFSAQLPDLLRSAMPGSLGRWAGRLGGVAGLGGVLFEELERALDQEMKKFIKVGTKNLIDSTVRAIETKIHEPSSQDALRNVMFAALDKPVSDYAIPVSNMADEFVSLIDDQHKVLTSNAAPVESFAKAFDDELRRQLQGVTVAELLSLEPSELGEQIADVSWPLAQQIWQDPFVSVWLKKLSAEIIEVVQKQTDES